MGKYFGTDGVRGKANVELTAEMAFKIGQALGDLYCGQKVVVGMDTRLSSSMLKHALCAGVCSTGAQAYDCGVVPTPTIAYITAHEDFVAGVMISASHNPYYDNGIKIFNHAGVKLDDATEHKIEAVIDGKPVKTVVDGSIGQVHAYPEALIRYKQFLKDAVPLNLKGLKVAIDAANGSATVSAHAILSELGAQCFIIHQEPDGTNINNACGSTHPQELQDFMLKHGCDIGFAFDGDADRLIAVDDQGQLFDGDKILYVCGKQLRDQDRLPGNTVVTTVMANLGLHKALKADGIHTEQTQVGDKYVYERMIQKGYVLGGEQSGHIIFTQHLTTGDGLLTALKLLEVMVQTKQSLSVLSADLKIFPQLLKNVRVQDKKKALESNVLNQAIEHYQGILQDEGRILVRPSGTEPLVRVMVEASTTETCHAMVDALVKVIQEQNL